MTRRSGAGRKLFAAALGLLLQACASPGTPVTQTVRVETPGCAQAACELSNDRGHWSLPSTPGTVSLLTSHQALAVSCRADSGALGNAGMPSSVPRPTGAGAVAGGVVGGAAVGAAVGAAALSYIPVLGVITVLSGVAIGAATGQAAESVRQSIRYPELISVPMNCLPAAAGVGPIGVGFGMGIRGLLPAEARDAAVGQRGAVLVTSVAAGGRAGAAGVRSGDLILTADGHALADAADLEERASALAPGKSLALRVRRDGQVLDLVLTRSPPAP